MRTASVYCINSITGPRPRNWSAKRSLDVNYSCGTSAAVAHSARATRRAPACDRLKASGMIDTFPSGFRASEGGQMTDDAGGSLPPAGWYDDPSGSGGKRYWDGTTWGETAPAPGAAASPPAGGAAGAAPAPPQWSPAAPEKKKRGRGCLTALAIAAVVIIGIIIIVGLPAPVATTTTRPRRPHRTTARPRSKR